MTLRPGRPLYDPRGSSEDDFLSGFVARKELLALLLNGLRHVARGGASEHQLIVGQRGMGKSSLLRAVAIGVGRDPELPAAFAPLRFREEQYNVNGLDAFWRNCGEALAQWSEDNGFEALARRLDRAIESPAWRDAETAAEGFLAACAEAGKRAILLIDNLDLVLAALKPGEPWALRRVLQMAGGPLVIGASTHFLKESGDRDAAFYEFFHPRLLDPLDESEFDRCLRALADRAGEAGEPVRAILETEPGRLRALYALTGGNPRVLTMIYQLLERRESGDVFADLEALLDQVTPYYKALVEDYATPQQRAVIDAIALNWDPILSHDLSVKSGIEITTVSTHLHRLKRDGFIEEVETSGARAGYQIAERFLAIWYLMRHGTRRTRRRLGGLATFFARLYTPLELGRLAGRAQDAEASRHWRADYRNGLIEAERLLSRTAQYSQAHTRSAADALDDPSPGLSEPTSDVAGALLMEANAATPKEDRGSALRLFARLGVDIDEAPGAPKAILVRAMVERGAALWNMGRGEEAIAVYDALDARFGADGDPAVRAAVATALVSRGNLNFDWRGDPDAAERCYRRALLLDPGSEPARANLAWLAITAGRSEDAAALVAASPSLPPADRALLDAALALAEDNFGSATGALGEALTLGLTSPGWGFFDDLLRLLRLADARGHGERLIGWFEASGFDIRCAPIHAAFRAMVRGERFLRDVNPEVRRPAREFYEKLAAPRRQASGATAAPKPGRGRRRKE